MARVIPFAFWVCLLLSSCTEYRQTDIVSAAQQVKDSVTTWKLPDAQFNTAQVTIANASNNTQSFYLTPANYDYRNSHSLASSIIAGKETEEEKAIAIWQFVKDNTYHSLPVASAHLPHEPLRLINSFGNGLCDDRNTALAGLFIKAGLPARVIQLGGHMVAEVNYDNSWHMYDADLNVYCLDDLGKVASVEYLSQHPEIVKIDFGKGLPERLLAGLTTPYIGKVYASAQNNEENKWQSEIPREPAQRYLCSPGNYNYNVVLNPKDELLFEVTQASKTDKMLRALFLHSLQPYTGHGTLKRSFNFWGENTVVEALPYAVTQVRLRSETNGKHMKVYFSPDSIRWFNKGTLTGNNELAFIPTSLENEPCSFNFFIKYVPESVEKKAVIKAQYNFLFSPLLFTNPEKTFKIVSADSTVLKGLSVKMEYTK